MAEVTVVMPALREREEMREQALVSVAAQTIGPIPVLTCFDQMPWDARNAMLTVVETEWTAFLDDDDFFQPEHLETLLEVQRETGADLVYPDAWGDDPNGRHLREAGPFSAERLRRYNFIPISYLVRTELARKVGFKPRENGIPSDWRFLLDLVDAGATFAYSKGPTWVFRHHDGNTWSWK